MKVYLAGPMTGLTNKEAFGWREVMSNSLRDRGIKSLVPQMLQWSDDAQRVASDLTAINDSDVMLANLTDAKQVSLGSAAEMGYAYRAFKPIVVVVKPGEPHDHLFVDYMATAIVPSLTDAITQLEEMRYGLRL